MNWTRVIVIDGSQCVQNRVKLENNYKQTHV